MRTEIVAQRLQGVPPAIQARLLAAHASGNLPAGATAVATRFFDELARRGEPMATPSRAAFDAACASEPTLGLLLQTLERHAPEVGLTEGRTARRDWYARRSGATGVGRGGAQTRRKPGLDWPEEWRSLLPGLLAAPVRGASIRRYVASVDRCAAALARLDVAPTPSWLLGYRLAKGFEAEGLRPATRASYVEGLICLGRHGGADPDGIDGLRAIRAWLQRQARRGGKVKEARIEALMERGGYEHVLRALQAEREHARALPAWSAEAEDARARAAILAVLINVPARTGDAAQWRLGREITRGPDGVWRLTWRQEKNLRIADAGRLWPEVCAVLDEHLLAGRPVRLTAARYAQLEGMNWLTLTSTPHASAWPSSRVKRALGVPAHDLRTLVAETLRDVDPEQAPNLVQAILGHATREAGEEYRALAAGEAAAAAWAEIRREIAAGGGQDRRTGDRDD